MPGKTPSDVTIGDFKRAPSSKPIVTKEPVKQSLTPEVDTSLDEEIQKAEDELKPLESYEETLKKAGISKEEAAVIIDDVLMKGFHSITYPITQRVSVTFRTRNYTDTLRVNTALEILRPNYQIGFDEIIYRYSLAASLEKLGTTIFKFPNAKDTKEIQDAYFDERLKAIEVLPEATVQLLYAKLSKFDEKIRTVLKEGAIENF